MKECVFYVPRDQLSAFIAAYDATLRLYQPTPRALTHTPVSHGKYQVVFSYNPATPEFLLLMGFAYCQNFTITNKF
jgi:hypothetical protein